MALRRLWGPPRRPLYPSTGDAVLDARDEGAAVVSRWLFPAGVAVLLTLVVVVQVTRL